MKKPNNSVQLCVLSVVLLIFCLTFSVSVFAESISGSISFAGKAKGDVYVCATTKNTEEIRNALNSFDPLTRVPNCTRVKLAGGKAKYKIPGLEPGQYYTFAWLDKDGSKYVNYELNEPLGWYSLDATWAKIQVQPNEDKVGINIPLIQLTLYPDKDKHITCKNGGGTLKTVEGKKVLTVWGKPWDRGYAQGYLVGPQIAESVRFSFIEAIYNPASRYEGTIRPWVKDHLRYTENDLSEFEGIIAGMEASHTNMYMPEVKRKFDLFDLMALNAFGEGLLLNCSAGAVWGPLTDNEELKKGVIAFRLADRPADHRKSAVLFSLIMVQLPSDPNLNKWISIMYNPGFIGTYTGMNEHGVVMEANSSGVEYNPLDKYGYTTISNIVREVLFTSDADKTDEDLIKVHNKLSQFTETGGPTVRGQVFTVMSPYYGQQNPVFVYEHDSRGGAIRYVNEDVEPNGLYCNYGIGATNHNRKYMLDDPMQLWARNTCQRYPILSDAIKQLFEDNKNYGTTVDIESFKQRILVTSSDYTLYANIFLPNEKRFMVAYQDLKNKIENAAKGKFTGYSLDDLFQPKMKVGIKIKPGSINLRSRELVSVTVPTTTDFDSTQLDPKSVLFAKAEPVDWMYTSNGNLTLHFRAQDLQLSEDSIQATLFATAYDGLLKVEGTGNIEIMPVRR